MTTLESILIQVKKNTISTSDMGIKKNNYKCSKCRDTHLIEEDGKYKKCTCLEIENAKNRWKNSGLGANHETLKLDKYTAYDKLTNNAKSKAIEYTRNFDNIKNIRENSIGFFGQPGSGKTQVHCLGFETVHFFTLNLT